MTDLNYPMPQSTSIPHTVLEAAAAGERELRTAAQRVVDEYYRQGNSKTFMVAIVALKAALAKVPA